MKLMVNFSHLRHFVHLSKKAFFFTGIIDVFNIFVLSFFSHRSTNYMVHENRNTPTGGLFQTVHHCVASKQNENLVVDVIKKIQSQLGNASKVSCR